jgi:hypothetical protein
LRRHRRQYATTNPDNREVNFVNFIKQIEETSDPANKPLIISNLSTTAITTTTTIAITVNAKQKLPDIKSKPESEPIVAAELAVKAPQPVVKEVKIVEPVDRKGLPPREATFNESKSYMSYESYRTEKVVNCMHDEIILCECCRVFPLTNTPMVSLNQFENAVSRKLEDSMNEPPRAAVLGKEIQGEGDADIFHLTTTGEETTKGTDSFNIAREKSYFPVEGEEYYDEEERMENQRKQQQKQQTRPKLRDILIANYDTKLATRIGVSNFVPIEVLNMAERDKKPDLEFIPFENIDHSYPRYMPIFYLFLVKP